MKTKRPSWNNKRPLLARARELGIACNTSWSPERLREAIRRHLYADRIASK